MTANRPTIDQQIMHFADFVRGVSTINSASREFHSRLRSIDGMARDMPAEARLQARHFLVELTDGEFAKSDLFLRARTRRNNHRGDYLLSDWICLQHATTRNPRGTFWDRFFHEQNAAKSLRQRCQQFTSELQRVHARNGAGTRVLSIGCGAGRDIRQSLLALGERRGDVHVTAIDGDQEAVDYAREVIGPTMQPNVELLHHDPTDFDGAGNIDGGYDLVWCGHLLDHLDERDACQLLTRLWPQVRPGGSLLVANLAATHRTRAWLDWCLEWPVHHRSEAEMRRLLTDAVGPHVPYTFDGDEWRTSHYLKLQKTC